MNKLNFSPFPTLKADRLLLRQLVMNDDERLFNYQSNKANLKFVDMSIYTGIEEVRNYVTKMNAGLSSNRWIIWGIAEVKTSSLLGTISILNISTEQSNAELGYGLFPGSLGKGVMSEAYMDAMNQKSIALLDRNQFTKISSFIETETSDEVPVEMAVYGCISSD